MNVLDWVVAGGTLLGAAAAAYAALQSRNAARQSEQLARQALDLELMRTFPFLVYEHLEVGTACEMVRVDASQNKPVRAGHLLVLTVRNIGGASAIVDQVKVRQVGSSWVSDSAGPRGWMNSTIDGYRFLALEGEAVEVEPGKTGQVAATAVLSPGHEYQVGLGGPSFPPLNVTVELVPNGGRVVRYPLAPKHSEVLRRWFEGREAGPSWATNKNRPT